MAGGFWVADFWAEDFWTAGFWTGLETMARRSKRRGGKFAKPKAAASERPRTGAWVTPGVIPAPAPPPVIVVVGEAVAVSAAPVVFTSAPASAIGYIAGEAKAKGSDVMRFASEGFTARGVRNPPAEVLRAATQALRLLGLMS